MTENKITFSGMKTIYKVATDFHLLINDCMRMSQGYRCR